MIDILDAVGKISGPGIDGAEDLRKIVKRKKALGSLLDE